MMTSDRMQRLKQAVLDAHVARATTLVQLQEAQRAFNSARYKAECEAAASLAKKPLECTPVPKSGSFTRHYDKDGNVLYVSVYYRNAGNNGGAYQLVGVTKEITGNIDGISDAGELAIVLALLESASASYGCKLASSIDASLLKDVQKYREGRWKCT